jgi:hypothetical protein
MNEPIQADVIEERAVVVQQPGQALITRTDRASGAADMVKSATELASVLKDIVERQRLYAVINNKRYPTVDAWMTIARMDNVVAREAEPPVRHDDGSYEGFAELIRLSDGMVIGRGSALCGTDGDRPWTTRAEPARRSMAVTRAMSRAFRAQYSWIMALAGYEPTPAEEMPRDEAPATEADRPAPITRPAIEPQSNGSIYGVVQVKPEWLSDLEMRSTPTGAVIGFRLKDGRRSIKVQAHGALAIALAAVRSEMVDQTVTCWGEMATSEFTPKGTTRPVSYPILLLKRIKGPFGEFPAQGVLEEPTTDPVVAGDIDYDDDKLWEKVPEVGAPAA